MPSMERQVKTAIQTIEHPSSIRCCAVPWVSVYAWRPCGSTARLLTPTAHDVWDKAPLHLQR